MLTKESILNADDLVKERVMVPEWKEDGQDEEDAYVFVRCLTGTERDQFESEIVENRGKDINVNTKNLRAKLLARAIVDKDNVRLFDDKDIIELGKKNAELLDRCFEVAQKLSGLRKEDVEELTKN